MYGEFSYGFKEVIVAAVLGSCVAGAVGAVTVTSVTARAPALTVSVNGLNKADRLAPSSILTQYPNDRSGAGPASSSPKRPPFGCDSAFSSISAPRLAHIFKRCLA
jgi:hypothetical protein